MSLLDNLPAVILPPPRPLASADSLAPVAVASVQAPKRFIIVCSRDVKQEEIDIFHEFGSTVIWKESFVNLPFSQLTDFDFLLIDARLKSARLTLGREDLTQYHVISYVSWIQKGIEEISGQVGATNEITSIPHLATNPDDFKRMLLNEKLKAPSVAMSVARFLLQCFRA